MVKDKPSEQVAFIGLGAMGAPMAIRLGAAGINVFGYDMSEPARSAVQAQGGQTSPTLIDTITGSNVVILMLPSSEVVESVIDQSRHALRKDTLIVDMSSSEPLRTRKLAQGLADDDIAFIDAPVSGGVDGARTGALTIMAGGEEKQLDRARNLLQHLGTLKHTGSVGTGHALKALNNLLSATHLWATSEAVHAGIRFGLKPEVMLNVINGSSGRSGSTENKWPNFILPGNYDSGFTLGLMLKDMRIATELARKVGAPSVLGEDVVDYWAEAEQNLSGTADHTEIARWISPRD